MNQDQLFSFSFQDAHIRGALVQTKFSFQELTTQHGSQTQYPLYIKHLLGEMNAILVLMASNLKLSGKMNLQIRGSGHLYSVFTEVQIKDNGGENDDLEPLKIRGIARRHDDQAQPTSLDLRDWVGQNATLAISLIPDVGQPYQGVIPLSHPRLHQCIEEYYQLSEQLPTFFWTQIEDDACAAIMIQSMPSNAEDEDVSIDLETAKMLANTLKPGELIETSPELMLHRLYHEFPIRQHLARHVKYECSCSPERMLQTLVSLGEKEITEISQTTPIIEMNCQFCGSTQQWPAEDVIKKIREESDS
ncbi:MAG: Hsp33 family molecular chaperone HslO [Pseudomonadota bacterium]|nr:hypothetical protein [Gammaproteobacteria bacterium]MEC8012386.1 Hsp33 family molecular chaperone HslO [Pseudomonadota bacterium]|tara:strand:+ start:762 stop:1673 length:912 start_codon:yes stop_codon:yes gene_type:complete